MATEEKGIDYEYSEDVCNKDEKMRFEAILSKQNGNPNYTYINDFWKNKYENEASIYWDKFYKKNTINFFKDRHYLHDEFAEMKNDKCKENSDKNEENESKESKESKENKKCFLEIGCGVGNALFPLMTENDRLFYYGIDLSKRAIDFVKENENYDESKCKAFVCDIVNNDLPNEINRNKIDYSLMLFVLSSIHPSHYINVFYKIFQCLKPNGYLFFRDYGRYDLAQLRFKPRSKLDDNFYVRDDGTRAYYFTIEEIENLVNKACDMLNKQEMDNKSNTKYQIKIVQNVYIKKTCQNKKLGLTMKRVWIQSKFQKIVTSSS